MMLYNKLFIKWVTQFVIGIRILQVNARSLQAWTLQKDWTSALPRTD